MLDRVEVILGEWRFCTTWSTLTPGCRFFADLAVKTNRTKSVILDPLEGHDPEVFYHVLEILRDPRYPAPKDFDFEKVSQRYGIEFEETTSTSTPTSSVMIQRNSCVHDAEVSFESGVNKLRRVLQHANKLHCNLSAICFDLQMMRSNDRGKTCSGKDCRLIHRKTATFSVDPTLLRSDAETGDTLVEWRGVQLERTCPCDESCGHVVENLWIDMSPNDTASVCFVDQNEQIVPSKNGMISVQKLANNQDSSSNWKPIALLLPLEFQADPLSLHLRIRSKETANSAVPKLVVRIKGWLCSHHVCCL